MNEENLRRLIAACGVLTSLIGGGALVEHSLRNGVGAGMAVNAALGLLIAGAAASCASLFPQFSAKASLFGGYCLLIVAGAMLASFAMGVQPEYHLEEPASTTVFSAIVFAAVGAGLCRFGWKRLVLNRTIWLTMLMAGGVAGISLLTWVAVDAEYKRLSSSSLVPNFLLFTTLIKVSFVAIAVFLWRNARDRLSQARNLNTNLQGKVAERTAQLHAIFDVVPIGVWSHDFDSGKAVWEGKTNEIYGFAPDQPDLGLQDLLDRIHPDDRARLKATSDAVAEASAAGSDNGLDLEYRVTWPDNSVHWVLIRAALMRGAKGEPASLNGIVIDVTRLKETELALQKSETAVRNLNTALERRVRIQTKELLASERRFRLMVEGLRDYAFVMLDIDGTIRSWSAAAEGISGYKAEEAIGKHFSIMGSPEDVERGYPDEELKLAVERGRVEETGWRRRRNGTRFWASVITTAVYDDAGDLCGFSRLIRDITERKLAKEQLEEQKRKAEESNLAKTQFLASMSHEIRTPMNAILGMADLLSETDLDQDQRHYVDIFQRAGSTLMGLINDILDLSKIESGRLELEQQEFDPGAVVKDVVELLAPRAREKHIDLRSAVAPEAAPVVIGDPGRLRQILVNLVGNAIKFTRVGEVVVSLEPGMTGTPGELKFAVSDTGIGISKEKLPTIFDAFTQADASTARKYGGTGLGLTISKRLVESMGGALSVESELARGSTFSFTTRFGAVAAPSTPATQANPAAEGNKPSNGAAKARILVAEDSVDNQFLIQAYLKNGPYTVSFVSDGQAAIKRAREQEFDAILMDVQMPLVDGLTATRTIRQLEQELGRKPVPIIAVTANAQREAVQASRNAGCSAHLSKPVSKGGLLRILSQFLSNPSIIAAGKETCNEDLMRLADQWDDGKPVTEEKHA